jgi:hypothetical protein
MRPMMTRLEPIHQRFPACSFRASPTRSNCPVTVGLVRQVLADGLRQAKTLLMPRFALPGGQLRV